MNRTQLLAAEVFNYSYANYQDHLGINERFDRLMPETVTTLE
jgi:Mn-dependent DtxR family transcriptional regulator